MEQLGNDIYLQMYKQGKALFNCLLNRDVLDGALEVSSINVIPEVSVKLCLCQQC